MGNRARGIGCPVAACFGDFDEAGAHGERGMAGIVGDGEDFVAQGRNQEQIHLAEHTSHFLADFAAESVGLHEIDGG